MGHYLFGRPVRVKGNGRWFRNAMGDWEMKAFTISSFDVLDDSTLNEVIATLRQMPGQWKGQPDTIAALVTLRRGEG